MIIMVYSRQKKTLWHSHYQKFSYMPFGTSNTTVQKFSMRTELNYTNIWIISSTKKGAQLFRLTVWATTYMYYLHYLKPYLWQKWWNLSNQSAANGWKPEETIIPDSHGNLDTVPSPWANPSAPRQNDTLHAKRNIINKSPLMMNTSNSSPRTMFLSTNNTSSIPPTPTSSKKGWKPDLCQPRVNAVSPRAQKECNELWNIGTQWALENRSNITQRSVLWPRVNAMSTRLKKNEKNIHNISVKKYIFAEWM